ncbi:TolC family protein [uncultured Aquitalea sp.]|uniref:TolC family protein n=1 Tax=uncultured Aquitalea sp. TaxID=540272 RepID=UPI0025EE8D4E|nr:TolC family protein [uncultured Aquitalea sp.]
MKSVMLLLASGFLSSGAQATDLFQAWEAAAGHDPQWLADQSTAKADAQFDSQARSFYLPKIGARAGIGQGNLVQNTEGAHFATPNMSSDQVQFSTDLNNATRQYWGVELRQPLMDAASFAMAAQLKEQAKAGASQADLRKQDAILRLADCYFGVLSSRSMLRAIEGQQQATARALEVASARYRNGDIPVTEKEEAAARLELLQAQMLSVKQQVDLAEQRYMLLTGLSSVRLADLSEINEKSGLDMPDLKSAVEAARKNNPVVAMAQATAQASKEEVEKYRAWKSPRLELVAQAGEDRWKAGVGMQNSRQSYVGLELNVPIFTGGYRSAKLEESLARSEASEGHLSQVENSAEDLVRSSWLAVKQGFSRVKALKLARSATSRQLDATRLGHEEGARTLLDVLNVQQTAATIDSELDRARYETALSWLRVHSAIGDLSIEQLAKLNALMK